MSHNQPTEDTPVRGRWIILAVLCLPVFIGSLDLTIVSAILPEIINQLKLPIETRLDDASWMVSAYLIAYTISMTFMGRISDMIGRRWVYVVSLLIFVFGAWFVSIAHTWPADLYLDVYRYFYPNPDTHIPPPPEMRELYMIILGRTVQAFGAGAVVPVTMAVVSDMFPKNQRAKPLGFVGAIDTSGWVLGHLYGGAMVKFFGEFGTDIADALSSLGLTVATPSWRTLFVLNIPFSLIALGGALFALRGQRFRKRYATGRFDYLGVVLISVALISVSIGINALSPASAFGGEAIDITSGTTNDGPAGYMWPVLGLAAASFVGFIVWELYTRSPLINLRMFLRRNYSASGFTNFCVGFVLALALVSVPLVINLRADSTEQAAFETAALIAGLVLSGLTVPMALAAVPGGWLSDRFGYRDVTVTGMALATFGFILCSLTWTSEISEWIMAGQMMIVGVGLGLTVSPVATALINEVDEGERGVSAALVLILRLIGMTLAIPGITAYALYRVEQRISELGTFDSVDARQDAYVEATVAQINELFLIGAAISFLALLAAWNLRGGQVQPQRNTTNTTSTYKDRRSISSSPAEV
jgi:MFS family permease